VRGADPPAAADHARQREIVDAFFAAAREGDLAALIAVLHPAVVLRIDAGAQHTAASMLLRGRAAVARQAANGIRQLLGDPVAGLRPVLVNGSTGVVVTRDGQPFVAMGFTIAGDTIAGIDAITDPGRVRALTTALFSAT
jgi:RNA polymerase sigma-70 factor (ECF subfamily)